MLTLKEEMALAVLRVPGGDDHAAYALADRLIEERSSPTTPMEEVARAIRGGHRTAFDGYEVYRWPEFQAFCSRLGVAYDLRTITISFRIVVGERVVITQEYAATDNPTPVEAPDVIDITTMDNETIRTGIPPIPHEDE